MPAAVTWRFGAVPLRAAVSLAISLSLSERAGSATRLDRIRPSARPSSSPGQVALSPLPPSFFCSLLLDPTLRILCPATELTKCSHQGKQPVPRLEIGIHQRFCVPTPCCTPCLLRWRSCDDCTVFLSFICVCVCTCVRLIHSSILD